jgi:hypothetical protein
MAIVLPNQALDALYCPAPAAPPSAPLTGSPRTAIDVFAVRLKSRIGTVLLQLWFRKLRRFRRPLFCFYVAPWKAL